jgi:hypothetical protein
MITANSSPDIAGGITVLRSLHSETMHFWSCVGIKYIPCLHMRNLFLNLCHAFFKHPVYHKLSGLLTASPGVTLGLFFGTEDCGDVLVMDNPKDCTLQGINV